jgi:hypothetical protein
MESTKDSIGIKQLLVALALALPSIVAIYIAQNGPHEYSGYAWFISGVCIFMPYSFLKKIPDSSSQAGAVKPLVSSTDLAFEGAILDYLNQDNHKDLSKLPDAIKRHPIRIAIENKVNRLQNKS